VGCNVVTSKGHATLFVPSSAVRIFRAYARWIRKQNASNRFRDRRSRSELPLPPARRQPLTPLVLACKCPVACIPGHGKGFFSMSKRYPEITPPLAEWMAQQHLFFVATAPLSPDGHVNLSPKGGDAFRVLGPLEVAYQDYTGSGAETAAHLRENGRIVIMFCAFAGAPKIVRLHGRGTVITPDLPRYNELAARFPVNPGARSIVHIAVTRVSDSCGYSVPCFEFRGDRDNLDRWATNQGPEGLAEYRAKKNEQSIDGLPAFVSDHPKRPPEDS